MKRIIVGKMRFLIAFLLCLSMMCSSAVCWADASSYDTDQDDDVMEEMAGKYKRTVLKSDGIDASGLVGFMNALGAEAILILDPDGTGVIDHSSAGLLSGDDEYLTWTADNTIKIYGETGTWWYENGTLYFETPSTYEEYERIDGPKDNAAQTEDDNYIKDEPQIEEDSASDSYDEQPLSLDIPDVTDGRSTLSAGASHTAALCSNGTVITAGSNEAAQCDTSDWTDIISISANDFRTVGLCSDGTVKVACNDRKDQIEVSYWTDIVAVAAGKHHTVGLRADGTVVAEGDNFIFGQCNVDDWTDIVAVAAGRDHTVGLKSDGTVVAVGYTLTGLCDVNDWTDIVAIAANEKHTVGLRSDGTVVSVGSNESGKRDVGSWSHIVAIAAGCSHTVGLRSDGTVVATGNNDYGQCDVSGWSDIVAIAAGDDHTVGLCSDGTVVATGNNVDGQCNVSSWSDIKLPNT